MENNRLHSEDYFGDARDHWWNRDFMELMAKRWDLGRMRLVLDAGCGVGHWSRVLAPYLHESCKVVGVDQEPVWVAKAAQRAQANGLGDRFRYATGDVRSLNFADNTFDMVTCQTLLIHVQDPKAVIGEFIRVLKPGGLLAVAEPNNLASTLVFDNLSFEIDSQNIIDSVRLHLLTQRGKAALGEGNNSIGDLLPGYFAQSGLQHLGVYLSDKASPLYAPYDSSEQRALVNQLEDWEDRNVFIGTEEESRRYFLAGGGSAAEFENYWNKFLEEDKDVYRNARRNGSFHTAGGSIMYLVSAIKPV